MWSVFQVISVTSGPPGSLCKSWQLTSGSLSGLWSSRGEVGRIVSPLLTGMACTWEAAVGAEAGQEVMSVVWVFGIWMRAWVLRLDGWVSYLLWMMWPAPQQWISATGRGTEEGAGGGVGSSSSWVGLWDPNQWHGRVSRADGTFNYQLLSLEFVIWWLERDFLKSNLASLFGCLL